MQLTLPISGARTRSKRATAPTEKLSATHPHKLLKIQLANAPSPQNRLRVPVKVSMLNKGSAISINADTANGSGNSTNKNQAVHAVT